MTTTHKHTDTNHQHNNNNVKQQPTPSRCKKPPLPVDRGWAWFVMLGVFINISAVMFFIRSLSLLFMEFLQRYNASATATTLAFGLTSASFALTSIIVTSIFLPRFEVRTLALVGSTLNVVAILGIAFSPNIEVLTVLFALLGLSHGIMSVPQTSLLGRYFKKRLSFANAFANLGIGLGTCAGPPFCRALLEMYGLRGAVLIMAALNLHCLVGSMLYRSPSSYAPPVGEVDDDLSEEEEEEEEECCVEGKSKADITTVIENLPGLAQMSHDKAIITEICNGSRIERTISLDLPKNGGMRTDEEHISLLVLDSAVNNHIGTPKGTRASNSQTLHTADGMHLSVPMASSFHHADSSDHPSVWAKSLDTLSVTSSIRYLSNPNLYTQGTSVPTTYFRTRARTMSTSTQDRYDTRLNSASQRKDMNNTQINPALKQLPRIKQHTCFHKLLASVSDSVLTNPITILLLLAGGIGHHQQAVISYMPVTGQENGLSQEQTPLLLTVVGVTDLVSKLSVGFFADLELVPRIFIVMFTQLVVGVILQLIRFVQGFGLMLAYQAVLGYTLGVAQTFMPVLVVDYLGADHMATVLSTFFLLVGGMSAVDHLTVGAIKDATDSFYPAYHYMGAMAITSVFIYLALQLLIQHKQRQAEKTNVIA